MQRCLIIDDSPVIRRVARNIVAELGYVVQEAEHGRQAFELCCIDMPSLILLDWQLPVMGPYEFLKALRSFGPREWPYIVYCTTEFDFIDIQRARAAGASDTLMKPFDRGTLTAKLERVSYLAAARATGDEPRRATLRKQLQPN